MLRPGGRAVVTDTDWGTAIVHPVDPALAGAVGEVVLAGTPNPTSGRRLPGQLSAAGLMVTDIGSQALVRPPSEAMPLARMLGAMAVRRGLFTPARRDEFLAGLAAGVERGDFLMAVTMFAVLARRP